MADSPSPCPNSSPSSRPAEPHILCDRHYRILAANAAYRANCGAGTNLIGPQVLRGLPTVTRCPATRPANPARWPEASNPPAGRAVHLHHTSTGESYENISRRRSAAATGRSRIYREDGAAAGGPRPLADAQGLIGRAPAFRHMLELIAGSRPPTPRCCSRASRYRQGTRRPGHPRGQPACRGPFVAVDCAGLPGNPVRERAVRPRAGRLHLALPRASPAGGGGQRRHAVPRRAG